MTYEELYKLAEEKGCDSLFLAIIKEEPLFPIDYAQFNFPEFGQKCEFVGNESKIGWKHGDICYIIGYMPPSEQPLRRWGWYEVVMPAVDYTGNPTEYVSGLDLSNLKFI